MIRTLEIRPVLNGFIVNIGCQVVVFASREALLKDLAEYLEEPEVVEMRYMNTALHADKLCEQVTTCQVPTPAPAEPPTMPCTRYDCAQRRN
jgi:hypothetical protein